MSLREELQVALEDVDLQHLLGRREAFLIGLFMSLCIVSLLIMVFHGHTFDYGMTSGSMFSSGHSVYGDPSLFGPAVIGQIRKSLQQWDWGVRPVFR